ncbi:hypothetical protein F4777DRAFT_578259 [Nemania sp. FL0916]|nr:hypothetical protein F4777DRAFT_578259 [Nemania sp. FL0916]
MARTSSSQSSLDGVTNHPNLGPRSYLEYYLNLEYNGAVQPLTEHALAALNDDFERHTWNGNIDAWVESQPPQFSSSSPMERTVSILRTRRSPTAVRTGSRSSRATRPPPSLPHPRVEHVADFVSGAGFLFDDVAACPTGVALLDEDLK